MASASSLDSLPKATGSDLIKVQLDVSSTSSIHQAVQTLESEHHIKSIDIVIANAGIAGILPDLAEATAQDIQPCIDINAYGQLELYKAVAPLLRASQQKKGRFVYMSSAGGSLSTMNNIVQLSSYGASKALGNFLFKWLALDNKGEVLIWSQHPGCVHGKSVPLKIH